MKLAIVGSTALGGPTSRQLITDTIRSLGATCIISGGAKGIDRLAAAIGRELGLEVIEHKPEVQQWYDQNGRKGFKSRNQDIADDCDQVLRIFWEPREQAEVTGRRATFGSGWTALQASKQGKPVIAYELTLEQDRNLSEVTP